MYYSSKNERDLVYEGFHNRGKAKRKLCVVDKGKEDNTR
jgi:hypothetical protein